MASDQKNQKPHDLLSELLKKELDAVDKLIHERMISEYAPRIPEIACLLYTSPSPRDRQKSRMPSSA